MNKKSNIKRVSKLNKQYRVLSRRIRREFLERHSSDDEYIADIERLRKALAKIENDYYSSNIKIERIEKKRNSRIILSKMHRMFSSKKKSVKS